MANWIMNLFAPGSSVDVPVPVNNSYGPQNQVFDPFATDSPVPEPEHEATAVAAVAATNGDDAALRLAQELELAKLARTRKTINTVLVCVVVVLVGGLAYCIYKIVKR